MNYIGIDHHKQYSHMTVMDHKGKVIKTGKVGNFRCEVEEFLEGLGPEMEAVIEAGHSSYTMIDLLEELGVKVKIAHPLQVKAIAKAKIKTDKRDSKILAHLLRSDLIPEVYHRDKENRGFQRILRQRVFFVATRTRVKNRITSLIAQQSEEVRDQACQLNDLFNKTGMEFLQSIKLSSSDQKLLDELLKLNRHLEGRIKESNDLVESLYARMTEARLIRTIPGFGRFFSVLVATEIGDVRRFEKAEKLHSYAGVIPSTYTSGDRSYHGKMIKQGNKWLRWAAVEAVWPAIRSDFDLKLFYQRRVRRKSANSAKMATAKRLLTIIYRVLKERREYIPYKRIK
jgi:transposase